MLVFLPSKLFDYNSTLRDALGSSSPPLHTMYLFITYNSPVFQPLPPQRQKKSTRYAISKIVMNTI